MTNKKNLIQKEELPLSKEEGSSIEFLLAQLKEVVQQLDEVSLDEGIVLYTKGLSLAADLDKKLKSTVVALDRLKNQDGQGF